MNLTDVDSTTLLDTLHRKRRTIKIINNQLGLRHIATNDRKVKELTKLLHRNQATVAEIVATLQSRGA